MFAKLYRYVLGPLFAGTLLLALAPLAAHADGGAPNRAYVAGTPKGVSIIDVGQQQIIGNLPAQGDPHYVLLSLDGRFLYVTQPQKGNVAVLAARTGDTICTVNVPGQPSLLAMDKTSNTLYAAGNGASSVTAFDANTCNVKRTLQTDGPVYGLAVAELGSSNANGGDQVWVSTAQNIDIFSDAQGQKLSSFPIAGGPQYISIPIGSAAYVTTRQGTVVAVGLAKHEIIPLLSGGQYGPMDFDEQTGEVFVPDKIHSQLAVLTPVNPGFATPHEPSRVIKLEATPNSIAITSDGQLGFVALQNGHVLMMDIPGRQLITTYKVGGNPQFIITGLNPPLIGTTPQQANVFGIILNAAAYLLIVALLIVPLIFFRRYSAARKKEAAAKQQSTATVPAPGAHDEGKQTPGNSNL